MCVLFSDSIVNQMLDSLLSKVYRMFEEAYRSSCWSLSEGSTGFLEWQSMVTKNSSEKGGRISSHEKRVELCTKVGALAVLARKIQ